MISCFNIIKFKYNPLVTYVLKFIKIYSLAETTFYSHMCNLAVKKQETYKRL